MAVGENDSAALVNDEASGVGRTGGLGVEGTACSGAEDDDGGDHLVECLPPILRGGGILLERRIDLHGELLLHARLHPRQRRLRSQPLHISFQPHLKNPTYYN